MAAPAVGRIEAGTVEVDGIRTFFRRLPGEGVPTLFVHGNPTHSQDWAPFLQRLSGPGIALDLPGWGRSARPPDFDYTMDGLARFVGRFLERLEVGEHRLVVHDWGSVALIDAQRHPERLRALVVINAVPLLPGYRWHWVARWFWRVPGLGEAFNATATRPALRLLSRQSSPRPGPLPDEHLDMI